MSVARTLAQFFLGIRFADLPSLAVERAQMVIASTLASAAAGRDLSSTRIIRELAREKGGTPEASIWFDTGPRLPAVEAARVNAVMSDAAASDDSDLRTIAHIGTNVTAAAIAVAERSGADGREVLTAIVTGYEAAGRIGEAIAPGFGAKGFHACVIVAFGGAVAAGRLLGLTPGQMAHALALCATSAGGLAIGTNSLAREYQAGLAVMHGLNAALAAGKGYTAEETMLEAPRGFFATFGGDGADVDAVTRDLGAEWDIVTDLAVKLVPGGHPMHAAVEAAVNASRAAQLAPDQVERIVVSGPRFRTLLGHRHPTDLAGAVHSLAYYMAAAVADRDFSWVHVTPEKITDPTIARLQDRVQVEPEPAGGYPTYHWGWGATVTVVATDGRTFSSTVDAPRGSGPRGINWQDIAAKYRTLMPAAGISSAGIERSLEVIRGFDRVRSMAELLDCLRGGQ